jgi:hypothetical protein
LRERARAFYEHQKQSQIVASLGAQLHRGRTSFLPASGKEEVGGVRASDFLWR